MFQASKSTLASAFRRLERVIGVRVTRQISSTLNSSKSTDKMRAPAENRRVFHHTQVTQGGMPSNNLQFALRSGLTMGSLFTGASMVHYILKPDLVRQEAPSKQNGLACAPRLPKLTCSRCESWACSSHRPCLTWQLQLRRLNEKLKGLLRRLPSAEQSRVLSSRLTWLDWATIPILPHQSKIKSP